MRELSTMNVFQLRKEAKDRGIEIPEGVSKKEQFLELLTANPKPATKSIADGNAQTATTAGLIDLDPLSVLKGAIKDNVEAEKELQGLFDRLDAQLEKAEIEIADLKALNIAKDGEIENLKASKGVIEEVNEAVIALEITPEIMAKAKEFHAKSQVAELNLDPETQKLMWFGDPEWPIFIGGSQLGLIGQLPFKLAKLFDSKETHCTVFVRVDAYSPK